MRRRRSASGSLKKSLKVGGEEGREGELPRGRLEEVGLDMMDEEEGRDPRTERSKFRRVDQEGWSWLEVN